ncbi:MAG: DUF6167 family protein [Nocardioides sp.]
MSRALWFVAGAGAGAYALTRARRAAEAFTPDGLADRLAGLALGAHLFGEEVRAGMAEKEKDVRERLAVAFPVGEDRSPVLELDPGAGTPDTDPPSRKGND